MNTLYIIAHIVGVNSQIKESFINNLYISLGEDVAIIDLDKIGKKIKNNKDFQKVLIKQNQTDIADLWKSQGFKPGFHLGKFWIKSCINGTNSYIDCPFDILYDQQKNTFTLINNLI